MKVSSSSCVVHSVHYETLKLWYTNKCTISQCQYSLLLGSCMFWCRHLQGAYVKISLKRDCEGSWVFM